MKTSIIEVGLSIDKVPEIQLALEQCLLATGDLLIGHQVYDDQALFVIRLLSDTLQSHLAVLTDAFRKQQVDSLQIIQCFLFKIVLKQENLLETLRYFPLYAGESWFTAASEKNTAYLCLNFPHLGQRQISWLATQSSIAQWTDEA